jgi:DNA-directed RNA polymerase
MFRLQALDALGSTKWKINNVVLDVLERMWKEGGRLADLEDGDDVSFCLEVNHN